jgi:hypothetical protein
MKNLFSISKGADLLECDRATLVSALRRVATTAPLIPGMAAFVPILVRSRTNWSRRTGAERKT